MKDMHIHENILGTIGDTPLVRLNRVTDGVKASIFAKVESFNPGGSVKDRIGINIVKDEIAKGKLKPGGTIVECTSGNTGCGLALVAAVMGFKVIFTMPDKMSQEKVNLLKAYGARVVMCPTNVPADSPESYYSVARRIVEETPGAITTNQYFNPLNPDAHYRTTGPEIWRDTAGRVDYYVAGLGTGGTISGAGRYLKEQNPEIKVIGVDTEGSILKHYFYHNEIIEAKPYLVEGIGEDIIPGNIHWDWIDEVVTAPDRESFALTRRLCREEGILAGGSCGSAVYGAIEVARELDSDKIVVVLLPDTGERYLSKVHSDEWMMENGMMEKTKTS